MQEIAFNTELLSKNVANTNNWRNARIIEVFEHIVFIEYPNGMFSILLKDKIKDFWEIIEEGEIVEEVKEAQEVSN